AASPAPMSTRATYAGPSSSTRPSRSCPIAISVAPLAISTRDPSRSSSKPTGTCSPAYTATCTTTNVDSTVAFTPNRSAASTPATPNDPRCSTATAYAATATPQTRTARTSPPWRAVRPMACFRTRSAAPALATLLLGQETLELGAELVGRRDLGRLREQVRAADRAGERVVLLLERSDHGHHLLRGARLPLHLGQRLGGGRLEGGGVQLQSSRALHVLQGDQRRLRERRLGQVVRDVHREAQRVMTPVPQAVLHDCAGARRELDRAEPRPVV